jgi:hypothetical protein
MKKLFLILTILFAASFAAAQVPVPVRFGPTLPATCAPTAKRAVLFYKTGATNGLYQCLTANTWTAVAAAGSGGITVGTTTSDGTANTLLKTNATAQVANATGVAQATNQTLKTTAQAATDVPLTIKLAGSQSANSFEIQPNGSTTPTARFASDGSLFIDNAAFSPAFKITDLNGQVLNLDKANELFQISNTLPFRWVNAGTLVSDIGMARSVAGVMKVTDGGSGIKGFLGGGTAVASATALPLPTGNVFHVTGTTTITSITATNLQNGVCITLIFDGILTLTAGNNLKMAGSFVTTANDTWTACFDGTNFYETGRVVVTN